MTRAPLWILAFALLAAGTIQAQQPSPGLPPGPAAIRGRLVHPRGVEAVSGAKVVLYAISSRGEPGVGNTAADAEGRFAFEGIANNPHTVYLVGANSGEVPFGARVMFAPGELERQVEIAMSDATADTTAVAVGAARVRVDRGCERLRIRQSHTMRNASDAVVFVPSADREASAPLLQIELPEDASGFEAASSEQGIEREGRSVRYWGPLHPGNHDIEFEYGVPLADAVALEIGFASGAERVQVLGSPEAVELSGPALSAASEVERDGEILLGRDAGALAPGASLALALALPAASAPSSIGTPDARIILELDDAALDVQEQHQIEVPGEAALPASASRPLFCLPLPPDAQDLRFSSATLDMGLSMDASGALAMSGPLPAGESVVSLRYIVPIRGDPVLLERRFQTPIDRLSVLVTDTGIVADTERLHPLRPLRTADRSYLNLEALAIEPGETIALSLRRLSLGRQLPVAASAGLVLLAALGALAFLTAPLRSEDEDDATEPLLTRAAVEREAVMQSIRALDEDFETGKVTAEDHARMRSELRARAVALLREEREAASPGAGAGAARCPSCGGAAGAQDRFCSQCGARLGTSEEREGEPR